MVFLPAPMEQQWKRGKYLLTFLLGAETIVHLRIRLTASQGRLGLFLFPKYLKNNMLNQDLRGWGGGAQQPSPSDVMMSFF